MSESPRWRRGYRCHGLWVGLKRVGFIGLPPGRFGLRQYGYGWFSDVTDAEGTAKTLREAKQTIEREYRKWKGRAK